MGIELNISKELANIGVAASELSSIERIILGEIKNPDFTRQCRKMLNNLGDCLQVVTTNLLPLAEFDCETTFSANYSTCYADYKESFLSFTGQPRKLSDQAYEEYLLLKTFKQSQTSYPLLKRHLQRLDEFIDKWVTNDAWLAMSIENLLKLMPRLLLEIEELNEQAPDEAYLVYSATFAAFNPFLRIILQQQVALTSEA